MSEISFHCSGLGSTPVGLWAQACNKITLFSGIACHLKKKRKRGVCSNEKLDVGGHWERLSLKHNGWECLLSSAILVSYRDVLKSSLEVKATGGGVVISVSFELHASVSEDWCVISPGGFREEHVTRSSMETRLG